MSDYIPLHIQSEIIKRLPLKSVVQCRSVSKVWKSLIDSPKFISSYHTCQTQTQHHLFVKYRLANEVKYVSIVGNDTFPNQISSINVPGDLVSLLRNASVFSFVNGLICFYGLLKDASGKNIAVLWNPSIKKSVGINISNSLLPPTGLTFLGFGVCPGTSDPKLVRINTIGSPTILNWEVEVFTLSTRVWKSVTNIPPAFRTCDLTFRHVFVDGCIYWHAFDTSKSADGIRSDFIISFDLKSDEFGEVCLPDRLMCNFTVWKAYGSLGLFDYRNEGEARFCDVWIMKEGATKSFTKMLSIKAPHSWVRYRVLEVRKNGEVIIENVDDTPWSVLEVYEPSSGRISSVGINGDSNSFLVDSYMETLLLLDQPNSIIH